MRFLTVDFECPGDKLRTKIRFRAPSVVGAEVVQFKCQHCQSGLLARVKRGRDYAQGQVSAQVKIPKPSDLLVAMLKEEAEHLQAEASDGGS